MTLAWSAVLAVIVVFLVKSRCNYVALPALPATPARPCDVAVIVPARNEAHQIGRCVASFADVPVIVVDDASSDGTASVARTAGATVIPAPGLAPGDRGKPNACAAGAAATSTEWLLFVDADTWWQPEFVSSATGYAESESLDVLSVFPRQQRVTAAERILLPYAFALYFCGVSARNVNSARSRESLANGQCLLIRRAAYERIGGHAAVRTSVIEDVALAALAKRHGLRLRVARAESLGTVRMYDGFSSIWRGFEKNSFRFLQINPLTGAQVMAASIALTTWLPAICFAPWPLAVAIALAPSILLLRWYDGSWFDAATAPLAIYGFQAIALAGMLKSLAGLPSTWKGRHV